MGVTHTDELQSEAPGQERVVNGVPKATFQSSHEKPGVVHATWADVVKGASLENDREKREKPKDRPKVTTEYEA